MLAQAVLAQPRGAPVHPHLAGHARDDRARRIAGLWSTKSNGRRVPVIVDLPATGHALSFLDTPRAVHRMFRIGPIAHAAERVSVYFSMASVAKW